MLYVEFGKIRNVNSPQNRFPDAGWDFFVPEDFSPTNLEPAEQVLIPSGIIARIPENYALVAFNKSGIATKKQLMVGACVIDSGYYGEIHIHLINAGNDTVRIIPNMKIVQFLLLPVPYVYMKEVDAEVALRWESVRGDKGFGSTGE